MRPGQQEFIDLVNRCGGCAAVVRSTEEALTWLAKWT
jgi:hypothetical protein